MWFSVVNVKINSTAEHESLDDTDIQQEGSQCGFEDNN